MFTIKTLLVFFISLAGYSAVGAYNSPAHDDIINGDISALAGILKYYRMRRNHGVDNDIDAQDNIIGNTLLHISVSFGSPAMTRLILKYNPNPNIRNDDGMTPLHLAAYFGRMDVAQYLLAYGANPIIKDGFLGVFGRTALDYAIESGYTDIEEMLAEAEEAEGDWFF